MKLRLFVYDNIILRSLFSISAITFFLGIVLLSGCGGGASVDDNPEEELQPDTVKIGMLLPIKYAASIKYAANLAIQEINTAGGVNGKELELVVRDDKDSIEAALQEGQELIDLGAVAIIGAGSSSVTIPLSQQVTIPQGIPLISPAASSPVISTLHDNGTVWRTVPSDAFQGIILANKLRNLGFGSISIIYRDDAYGGGLGNVFMQTFQSLGGNVLSHVAYQQDKLSGFESEVSQLFQRGTPDGIVVVALSTEGSAFMSSLSLMTQYPLERVFGVDSLFSLDFIQNSTISLQGMRGTSPTSPRNDPNYAALLQKLEKESDAPPDAFTANGYDTVYLVALAMAKEGKNTAGAVLTHLGEVSRPDSQHPTTILPGQFLKALEALSRNEDIDYNGASGKVDFDVNGDVTSGSYLWWKIVPDESGKLNFKEQEVISYP